MENNTLCLLVVGAFAVGWVVSWSLLRFKQQKVSELAALEHVGTCMSQQLLDFDRTIQEMQRNRAASDADLKAQLVGLTRVSQEVGHEANRLRGVLTNSRVRGEWGQLELRRIVEAAGMVEHCDFFIEESAAVDGKQQRPDMRVQLPNGLSVMIDAKAPAAAYARAVEVSDPAARRDGMRQHVAALKGHVREMAKRDYPSIRNIGQVFSHTIIFLPNESLFYAAMEADGELLSFAEQNRVILVTPLSLIAFLRAVAAGWTHVKISENAQEILQAARVLHERLLGFVEGVGEVGKRLEGAVRAFNSVVGRQQNMRASFKRLADLGIGDRDQCAAIGGIDLELRQLGESGPDLQ